MNATQIIQQLGLTPHPEGGFYRETYRHDGIVALENEKIRNTSTAIYYLLQNSDKSHFHRLGSDELWFFHQGNPLEIYMITDDGQLQVKVLGNSLERGEE